MNTFIEDLIEELKDREFAKEYGIALARDEIAVTLSKARNTQNVTQTELANMLDVKQSYIAKLEQGEANPTIGTIGKFLSFLGLRLLTGFAPLNPNKYFQIEGLTITSAPQPLIESNAIVASTDSGLILTGIGQAEPVYSGYYNENYRPVEAVIA